MTENAWQSDKRNKGKNKDEIATAQMMTIEYRRASWKLSLIGSDEVVKSFNDLMQHFYESANNSEIGSKEQVHKMLALLGTFLLEIRKSMGDESTSLDNWGMLEWFMTDARKMRRGQI